MFGHFEIESSIRQNACEEEIMQSRDVTIDLVYSTDVRALAIYKADVRARRK
jgi:hypothetical protein